MKTNKEDLSALVAQYYRALAGEGEDVDGHWSITERWAYGEHLGWFVEHEGHSYDGFREEQGEEGPHASLEEARSSMAAHLRTAIAKARAS